MTVHLWDHNLTYVSVPKCGCTSLKMYFHEVQTGQKFQRRPGAGGVHKLYRSTQFLLLPHHRLRSHKWIAVVRDPISRFLSAYRSKVVDLECLKLGGTPFRVRMMRLSQEPSLEEFLRQLPRYQMVCPVVFKHFRALSFFLGRNPGKFMRLFRLDQLDQLQCFVRQHTGFDANIMHRNKTRLNESHMAVSQEVKQMIAERYKSDYALFGRSFENSTS